MMKIADLSVVFMSYDEPRREAFWRDLKRKFPKARRVHGLKGLDRCFKAAVALGETEHVITVDGDCVVDPAFFDLVLDDDLLHPCTRIDWPSRNVVNALVSGNGGLKCWPKPLALAMRSHETADPEARSVDFPRPVDLDQIGGPHRVEQTVPMATVHCNGSPLQAFRSGFREAVRLALPAPEAPRKGPLPARLHPLHLHRLLIWCSVGADVPNGAWCIYGARLGCQMVHGTDWDYLAINDFDWFDRFWEETVAPRFAGGAEGCEYTGYRWYREKLQVEITRLGESLRADLGLACADLDAARSRFFKQVYEPPFNLNRLDALGTMLRRGIGVGQNPAKAARCYQAAARVGHPSAMYNLARMYLSGEGVGTRDPERALALLREATALGNPYAPHQLGRMHRSGQGAARDAGRALECFRLAAKRGFVAAHRDIAEMHEAGEGVAQDRVLALAHYRRALPACPELGDKIAALERQLAGDLAVRTAL